ncbi:MAG: hypothetical protein IPG67_17555 [Acidobacteria bacterium]|nr:hypothetical protein [Acidobacteriota bacterium]
MKVAALILTMFLAAVSAVGHRGTSPHGVRAFRELTSTERQSRRSGFAGAWWM